MIDRHELVALIKLVLLVATLLAVIAGLCVGIGLIVNWWFAATTAAMAIGLVVWCVYRSFSYARPW